MSAPCSLSAVHRIRPSPHSTLTPIRSNPSKWMSRGRAPILHPPGEASSTSPHRESNAPSMNTEDLMPPASPGGMSVHAGEPVTVISLSVTVTSTPRARSTPSISSTSVMCGQSLTVTGAGGEHACRKHGQHRVFCAVHGHPPAQRTPSFYDENFLFHALPPAKISLVLSVFRPDAPTASGRRRNIPDE